MNTNLFPDSTTVGFNKDWIVVQAVMRYNANTNFSSHFYVFSKTNLYAGGSNAPVVLTHESSGTIGGEIPAFTYDNSLTNFYIVQNANGTNGALRLFTITSSNGVPVLNYANSPLYIQKTNCTWIDELPLPKNNAPQKGTTNKINTGWDSRIQNVVYRNGSLWCVQTVFLNSPSRSAIQWWQIDPVRNNIVQVGRIDDLYGTNFYGYPSIAVNRFNDVMIGYSSFSSTQYGSANYSFRAFYDSVNSLRSGYLYKTGEATFLKAGDTSNDANRWGDYSATVVDPVNDADMWTLQEYAEEHQDGTSLWGTWWAKVAVALPTNDAFASPRVLSGRSGTTNGTTIRATKEVGEPSHGGCNNLASVWYQWTATNAGDVTFAATNGSTGLGIESVLAVYTGSAFTNLSLVVSNCNSLDQTCVVFSAASNTTYRVAVAGCNGTMRDFTLYWNQTLAPYFVRQPYSSNVIAGESVTLSAQAIGAPLLSYQWRLEGTNLLSATNTSYTITNVQTSHMTNYVLVVTNAFGSVTSSVAGLFVKPTGSATMSLWQYTTNSQFLFHVSGVTNRGYVVEATTNLVNWTPLSTNVVSFDFTNGVTANFPYRFFRVLYQE